MNTAVMDMARIWRKIPVRFSQLKGYAMFKVLFASTVLTAAFALSVLAADGPTGATRSAIGQACAAEVQSYCPNETHAGKIARCLRPHKNDLSEECQTALANARQARRADRANDANDDSGYDDSDQPSGY